LVLSRCSERHLKRAGLLRDDDENPVERFHGDLLEGVTRFASRAVLAAAILALAPFAAAALAGADAPSASKAEATGTALTYGSKAVLERLWTTEQLRGTPSDTRIRRLRPPDRRAPEPPGATAERRRAPPEAWPKSIRRVLLWDDARLVALTFDLCERADDVTGYDGAIVDTLRSEAAPATFFAGGKWLRTHPERAMQLIADPLFEIGNHAWTHGNLRVLTGEKAEQQITWPQVEYARLRKALAERATAAGLPTEEIARIPPAPTLFRFPYGVCSRETLEMTARHGLAAIQWDVISGDAKRGMTPAGVTRVVLDSVRPGSIVVFHANGREQGTPMALSDIIRGLRAKGYRMVTVGDLLRAGEPAGADDCYELRPGDNKRYDKLFGEGTG
jgi:peptidoglycan/xylan/chitin deacetylase (PgdA/CDA1 family)